MLDRLSILTNLSDLNIVRRQCQRTLYRSPKGSVTIWSIIIVMSVWDFVIGVLAGIVFCCTCACSAGRPTSSCPCSRFLFRCARVSPRVHDA